MIGYIKRYNNVLLIDEVSMLSEHQKEKIFEIYDDMKIVFLWDLGYQLSSFTSAEMTPKGFDEIIQKDTNNYHLGFITSFITAYQRLNVWEIMIMLLGFAQMVFKPLLKLTSA